MAKNKSKGQKQKNVFQVANKHMKQKNKAKPVTTSLKHINAAKKEKKVDSLNKIFTDVQREVKSISKCTAEPKKPVQVIREQPRESVNVDGAAQLFSQL
ncbi:hypothetical protein JZ751_013963 [Albula glossodonta]|uniref:Uncharacterized protein n=1 Tax=Albula glossodonta TaxID=121402 RepID=A0A8T2MXW7_9TELE|nr:hypothetical protein JZ751_013963 [Albula glossodonta]